MPKITFMGAGSTVFARNVLGDCMCTPSLCESEIALYDIDAERLEESYIILSAINKNTNGGKATLKTYCGVENRKEALRGAPFLFWKILPATWKKFARTHGSSITQTRWQCFPATCSATRT